MSNSITQLIQADTQGGIRSTKKLITWMLSSKMVDINGRDEKGQSPLHAAVAACRENLAKIFLEHGARIDAIDEQGNTPLHLACAQGHPEIVKFLLKNGANITITNSSNSFTPLTLAVRGSRNPEVIDAILRHGCRLEKLGERHKEYYRICRAIFDRELSKLDGNLNFSDINEENPLFFAVNVRPNETEIIKILLDKIPLNLKNANGETILFDVLRLENDTIFKLLIGKNIDFDAANNFGVAPVHIAGGLRNPAFLNFLLNVKKCRIDAADSRGKTVLNYAAANQKTIAPLKSLVGRQICKKMVNIQDGTGNVPLHDCVSCAAFLVLLEAGADFCIKNESGQTPMLPKRCGTYWCPMMNVYLLKLRVLNGARAKKIEAKLPFLTPTFFEHHRDREGLQAEEEYIAEIKLAQEVALSVQPKVSIFDVMFMKRDRLVRYAKNEELMRQYQMYKGNFEKKYTHYGFILNSLYRKSLERRALMSRARTNFENIVIRTKMPDQCSELIFKYLSNTDLKTFVEYKFSEF